MQEVRKLRREAPILQADPGADEETARPVRHRSATRRAAPLLIAILPLLSAGEQIFSELTGTTSDGSGTGRGRGTFVGGTGRFEGITGSYEIDRVSVPSLDPEKIASRSSGMQGTWERP